MNQKKETITRKVVRAGSWQLLRRTAKMLPFGGTLVAVALVGTDIRKKGVVNGIANSALDAIPVLGLVKNGVELVRGDFFPDRERPEKIRSKV